jgi:hypothetical protein
MVDKSDWMEKARGDLGKLTKDQLIEKIIQKRKETFSKTGKRNVATSKSHERRCKKLLTEWAGVEFRRRRVEGRGDDVSVVEGVADIIPVEGKILFAIESKKGEDFSLDGLFLNSHGARFTKWWHQVNYDAKLLTEKLGAKRWPLLFFKPHPNWDWVAVPIKCFENEILVSKNYPSDFYGGKCWFQHISYDAYRWIGPVTHNIATSTKNKVMEALDLEPCIMCRWKDFATNVDPQSIFVQT